MSYFSHFHCLYQAKVKNAAAPSGGDSGVKPDKKQAKKAGGEGSTAALKPLDPPPEYLPYRVDLWQQFIENQRLVASSECH